MKYTYEDFARDMGKAPWKGLIAESAFGLPFSWKAAIDEELSKSVLYSCHINDEILKGEHEFVSKDGAEETVEFLQNFNKNIDGPRYYLAINGKHSNPKEDSDSECWICLKTVVPDGKKIHESISHMHLRFEKTYHGEPISKSDLSNYIFYPVRWLMSAVLIGVWKSWEDAIDALKASSSFGSIVHVDLLYNPVLSDEAHLQLLSYSSPMVYDDKVYQNVTESIRKFDRFIVVGNDKPSEFYSKIDKQSLGLDALYVLDFDRGTPNGEIMERVKEFYPRPVMVSTGRKYVALLANLIQSLGRFDATLIMDSEKFNQVTNIDNVPIPNKEQLLSQLSDEQVIEAKTQMLTSFLKPIYNDFGFKFEVYKRDDVEVEENQWTEKISYELKTM